MLGKDLVGRDARLNVGGVEDGESKALADGLLAGGEDGGWEAAGAAVGDQLGQRAPVLEDELSEALPVAAQLHVEGERKPVLHEQHLVDGDLVHSPVVILIQRRQLLPRLPLCSRRGLVLLPVAWSTPFRFWHDQLLQNRTQATRRGVGWRF